jgi:hypothetical protein
VKLGNSDFRFLIIVNGHDEPLIHQLTSPVDKNTDDASTANSIIQRPR